MAESDVELELLAQDDGTQILGEHELKTTPLISKDALDLSKSLSVKREDGNGEEIANSVLFAQRALLGKILSVHSENLKGIPDDIRLYMNLDAPSSGLVCGVQVINFVQGIKFKVIDY
jgi:hypothetical protein